MLKQAVFCLALVVVCNSDAVAQQQVESSRIYGKMYVSSVEAGKYPPVCVTKPVGGPEVKKGFAAMRDASRPSIVVFVKKLDNHMSGLLRSLDACTTFSGLPCFLTITDEKGIARVDSDQYPQGNYYTMAESSDLVTKLENEISEIGLKNMTSGIAVNRFWAGSIGYGDSDLIVAYVRGRVRGVFRFDSATSTNEDVAKIVRELGELHRDQNAEDNADAG